MLCLRLDHALSVTPGSRGVGWVKEGGEGVGGLFGGSDCLPEVVTEEREGDIGGCFSYPSGSAAVH